MKRALIRVGIIGLALVAVFCLAGGWYFSGEIDSRALDGAEMRASCPGEFDLEITHVGDGTIDLVASGDVPTTLTRHGTWGLRWEGGYGRIQGPIALGTPPLGGGGGAQHSFEVVSGNPPVAGDAAQIDSRAYSQVGQIPLMYQDVSIQGPLGGYPAWFWPGKNYTWAIVVHGNSMSRLDGARAVPIFAGFGLPVLVPTYRNDPGAPEDPSGKLRYGLTEWEDLEAAVQYALDQGASDVILDGYSMGGGVVMSFMDRSPLASRVSAIVLDAPMLNFGQTVDDNASRETLPVVGLPLPSSLTATAKLLASLRFGVDWSALDYLDVEPKVPVLIFHGTEDLTVPISTSKDYAQRYPGEVTLVSCPGTDHIQCWNVDPPAYTRRIEHFLQGEVGANR